MVFWCNYLSFNDGYRFYWLRTAMGSNEFLGATVITSMVTAIPIAGQPIVQWLWGGYTVGNPTLNRFFSLHFYYLSDSWFNFNSLILLHKDGSNSPIGSDTGVDDVPFTLTFLKGCFLHYFAS
jgi:quinol-cytochrome oxidoreductase complex cytochrome b subunit